MCYRCQVCNGVVGKGMPEKRYTQYRKVPNTQSMLGGMRLEIAREMRVCSECHSKLGSGEPITSKNMVDKQLEAIKKKDATAYYTDTKPRYNVKGNIADFSPKYTKPKHDKKNQQTASKKPLIAPISQPVTIKQENLVQGKSVLKNGHKGK